MFLEISQYSQEKTTKPTNNLQRSYKSIYRRAHPETFCKKGLLIALPEFTGEQLCQSHLIKTRAAQENSAEFSATLFYRSHLDAASAFRQLFKCLQKKTWYCVPRKRCLTINNIPFLNKTISEAIIYRTSFRNNFFKEKITWKENKQINFAYSTKS